MNQAPSKTALRICVIGGGQMGTALAKGLVTSNILPQGSSIIISDPFSKFGVEKEFPKVVTVTRDNKKAIHGADLVILAVKPQVIPKCMEPLRNSWTGKELFLSICAGTSIAALQSYFPTSHKQRIVRMIPNTPALVQALAGGICTGQYATKEDLDLLLYLFSPLGVLKVMQNEKYLDAVTGLSGSGPAYVFMMIEALADGGVQCGLHRQDALELAAQTVYGAAKMVIDTGKHPAQLKDAVASPAGTTIAGIKALEKSAFRYGVITAVEAGAKRSEELGRPKL